MTAFASRGRVPVEGRCLWCGAKLRAWIASEPERGVGYSGTGQFCTLGCGFHFGARLAELGRRLTSSADDEDE